MSKQNDAYFVLAAWCTVSKVWKDGQGRYDSVQDAERDAADPGIYRVAYVTVSGGANWSRSHGCRRDDASRPDAGVPSAGFLTRANRGASLVGSLAMV